MKHNTDIEKTLTMMMTAYQQKPVWHISVIEPYFFIQGTFVDLEMEAAKQSIREFAVIAKRMQ